MSNEFSESPRNSNSAPQPELTDDNSNKFRAIIKSKIVRGALLVCLGGTSHLVYDHYIAPDHADSKPNKSFRDLPVKVSTIYSYSAKAGSEGSESKIKFSYNGVTIRNVNISTSDNAVGVKLAVKSLSCNPESKSIIAHGTLQNSKPGTTETRIDLGFPCKTTDSDQLANLSGFMMYGIEYPIDNTSYVAADKTAQ